MKRKFWVLAALALALLLCAGAACAETTTRCDFDALEMFADLWETPYLTSTFWFDAHYAVFALTLCVTVLLILNAIWKKSLMSQEESLIQAGRKAVSA